jgi:hypothetical protein
MSEELTGDPTLDAIAEWCDEHGWDKLGSSAMETWALWKGIDLSQVTIHKCGAKCEHVFDGMYDAPDGSMSSRACSKCGRLAIDIDMREGI